MLYPTKQKNLASDFQLFFLYVLESLLCIAFAVFDSDNLCVWTVVGKNTSKGREAVLRWSVCDAEYRSGHLF